MKLFLSSKGNLSCVAHLSCMCAQLWDCGLSLVMLYIFEEEFIRSVYTLPSAHSRFMCNGFEKTWQKENRWMCFPCRLAVLLPASSSQSGGWVMTRH